MQEAVSTRGGGPTTEMFGREPDYGVVIALVTGGHRLVTLTGRGGVGKTRLALEVLEAYRSLRQGPAALVQLSILNDPELVLPEVATRLGVPLPPGQTVLDVLAAGIAYDDLLLVLDNFEHVTGAAAAVGELVERCPGLRVLATSQAPLHLRAERLVHIDPLPLPAASDSDADIDANPAVQLYCERAGSVARRFRCDASNRKAIAELCRRLEGLPLAIELAAGRAGTLPASEILTRLDAAPLDLLRQPHADAPARHHDLRAAIHWTYALLAPDEQRLLRRVSVTTGVFDIDTAAALDDESSATTVDRLAALVELRLIDLIPATDPAQYATPFSIQAFAREELERSDEATFVGRRLVTRAAERADELAEGLESVDGDAWSEVAAETEMAQLHALEAALDLEMVSESLRIVVALAFHWRVRAYYAPHRQLVDRALALAAACGDESTAHAKALSWSAILEFPRTVPKYHGVLIERLRRGEQLARRTGDEDALLLALSTITLAATYTADFPWARAAVAEALERLDDARPRWLARFRVWAGMLAHVEGDIDRAVDLGLQGLAGATREHDSATIVTAILLLLPLTAFRPDLQPRMPSSATALALAHGNGFTLLEAQLGPLATVEATMNGDVETARERCLDTLVVARSFGDSPYASAALVATVETLVLDGNYEAGAYFHGVVRHRLPFLEAVMVPAHREAVARSTAMLHRQLGDDGFEIAADKGAQRTPAEGVVEALDLMRAATEPAATTRDAVAPDLTPRQLETLALVAEGLTNKEIAVRLGITPKTVMHHLTIVFQILGVRTRTEAALWATAHGIRS